MCTTWASSQTNSTVHFLKPASELGQTSPQEKVLQESVFFCDLFVQRQAFSYGFTRGAKYGRFDSVKFHKSFIYLH